MKLFFFYQTAYWCEVSLFVTPYNIIPQAEEKVLVNVNITPSLITVLSSRISYRSLELGWFIHDLRIPWIDGPNSSSYRIILDIKGKNKVPFGPTFQALVL